MSRRATIELSSSDGCKAQLGVPLTEDTLTLSHRYLVGVSSAISLLQNLHLLSLEFNGLSHVPDGVFALTRLTKLSVNNNVLRVLSPDVGRLTGLVRLCLDKNELASVPRELGRLVALEVLMLNDNVLTALPSELSRLPLKMLHVQRNLLTFLPLAFARLPASTKIFANGNAELPHSGAQWVMDNVRPALPTIFEATSHVWGVLRENALVVAIGLQDLELPALITLEIIDAAFPNAVPMHKKWDLVTAVKHFRRA